MQSLKLNMNNHGGEPLHLSEDYRSPLLYLDHVLRYVKYLVRHYVSPSSLDHRVSRY